MSIGMFSSLRDAMRRQSVSFSARAALLKARLRGSSLGADEDPSLRYEEYACFYLCGDCGYLGKEKGPCLSCGGGCIDLRDASSARYLQDAEESERRVVPSLVLWSSRLLSVALFLGLSQVWLYWMEWVGFPMWSWLLKAPFLLQVVGFPVVLALYIGLSPVFLVPGLALFLAKEAQRPMSRLYFWVRALWRKERPKRWGGAVPELHKIPSRASFQGRVRTDAPLLSPLTKRPCLAYRVEAFLCDPLATQQQVWMLDESKACSFEWEGHTVDGERVVPCLETKEIASSELSLKEEDAHLFLRKRGLYWEDGDYILREAIIPVDVAVSVYEVPQTQETQAPVWAIRSL